MFDVFHAPAAPECVGLANDLGGWGLVEQLVFGAAQGVQ